VFWLSTPKKCPLCSKLSSKLNGLFRWPFGNNCRGLNRRSYNSAERVAKINEAAPDCACEKYRMSAHSPGVVENSELLARFVFSPLHFHKKNGKLMPNVFSHVHNKGCSIQRDSIAKHNEIVGFIKNLLLSQEEFAWKGLLLAECKTIRGIFTNNSTKRAVCVYDTAERENPAHAEICQTHYIEEDDEAELRHDLFVAFGNREIISPEEYRGGVVLNDLPELIKLRT